MLHVFAVMLDSVAHQLIRILQAGDFWDDFEVTVLEVAAGFAIAAVSGCLVGYLIRWLLGAAVSGS